MGGGQGREVARVWGSLTFLGFQCFNNWCDCLEASQWVLSPAAPLIPFCAPSPASFADLGTHHPPPSYGTFILAPALTCRFALQLWEGELPTLPWASSVLKGSAFCVD